MCRRAASGGSGRGPGPVGQYRSGRPRQNVPARVRHRIPSINRRRAQVRSRPDVYFAGSSGSSRAHCRTVRPHAPHHLPITL